MSIIIFFLLTIVGVILYGTFLSYEEKKTKHKPKKIQREETKEEDDILTNPMYCHLHNNIYHDSSFYHNEY